MNTSAISSAKYAVEIVSINAVRPSPENDDIYGKVVRDSQMESLVKSIRTRGIEEPIIVSTDGYIISGHRRYFACKWIGQREIPIRRKKFSRKAKLPEWHRILTEYNPQRVKTAGTLLKEAMLRHASDDPRDLLHNHRRASIQVDAEFTEVDGLKIVRNISDKKQEFLIATKKVVDALRKFWPVSIRQVHYRLLNDPPLISRPKRSKYDLEHYRYCNDKRSYDALIELMKQARYAGEINMHCIDDPTRPQYRNAGSACLSDFLEAEMNGFLLGYHRDRQLDQPRHIEVLGEKNTLMTILRPVCEKYYVPLTLGRGYASIPIWRDMNQRFRASGKDAMTLIVASDYDPEGLDLAKDAIRSLKDMWGIPVDYHRVSVTRDQIDELDVAEDFNPAKVTSSRFATFVEETGGEATWELESLPPDYLQEQVRAAIEANMDMDIYEQTIATEESEAEDLASIREEIISEFNF